MNNKDKVAIATSCLSIAFAVVRIIVDHKTESAKREHIRAEGRRSIAAIEYAKENVLANLDKGEYDGKGFPAVLSDIEFYQIAHRAERE